MKKIYYLTIALFSFSQARAQWALIHETTETNFYTLYALDKERVFLGSEIPAVHRSNDGGSSFSLSELQPFGFVHSIDFENDQVGYAGGGCYFPFDQCPGNTLFRTEDGGMTWDTLLGDLDIGVFTEIEALGSGKLFALNDYGGMFQSQDGGQSLQSVQVTGPDYHVFLHMQFLDAQRGFVSTRTVVSGNNDVERLHVTADGGATWATIYETTDLFDFHFTDAQHGMVAVPGGKLLRTDNSGTDWTEQAIGSTGESVTDLFFVDSSTAYLSTFEQASYHSRIYRSNDGGGTWAIDAELDSIHIGALYFVDKENGWALADYRLLLQRTGVSALDKGANGGLPFQLFPNPSNSFFTFHNPNEGSGLTLLLSDAMGRHLKSLPLSPGDNRVALDTHLPGLYFLKVMDKAGQVIWSGKVVKGNTP